MNYILYIIISLVIVAVLSVIFITFTNKEEKGGEFNPIVTKKNCDPNEDSSKLIPCDPNNDMCSSDICSNELTQCYAVTEADPYKVNIDGKQYDAPVGNWCLPKKTKQDQCNPFVSTALLAKDNKGNLKWICDCKYPNLFTKEGVDSDCKKQLACAYVTNEQARVLGEDLDRGQLVSIEDDSPYNFGYDPRSTQCKCKPGYRYKNSEDGTTKLCISDSCKPGGKFNTESTEPECKCDEPKQNTGNWQSYIRCPQDIKTDPIKKRECEKKGPQCIRDPCNIKGYYDAEKEDCICNENEGYYSTDNNQSLVGKICSNPCLTYNPCGNKGTCYYDKNDKKTKCICSWPYITQPDGTCI